MIRRGWEKIGRFDVPSRDDDQFLPSKHPSLISAPNRFGTNRIVVETPLSTTSGLYFSLFIFYVYIFLFFIYIYIYIYICIIYTHVYSFVCSAVRSANLY